MKDIFNSLKEYISKRYRINKKIREDQKKYKIKQKEQAKLDKEIDKEIKQKEKEERLEKKKTKWYVRLYNFITDFYKDMADTKDEKELYEVMTESQKKDFNEDKKFEKRFTITAISLFITIIVLFVGGVFIFRINTMTEFESTIKPMIEDYYANTFNSKDKLKEINYLTYKDENNQIVKSNIVLATFSSGINVMTIDATTLGDDVSYQSKYDEYKEFIRNNLSDVKIYNTEPLLTYNPYVLKYNMYLDYIDVLPVDKTFEELKNDQSLTVIDRISYEGYLNVGIIQNILSNFSDNSVYYLFQMQGERLLKFSIVTKYNIREYDITSYKKIGDDVTFFEFDSEKNVISGVDVTKISDLISDDYNYQYTYNKKFEPIKSRGSIRRDDTRTKMYLVRMDKAPINGNYVYLDINKYEELEVDKYPDSIYFRTSYGVFVLAEKEVAIGNKQNYEAAWYCRFGFC